MDARNGHSPMPSTPHPALSIVTAVYNEAPVIDELITQVTSAASTQTADWELIVVNDGSQDDTLAKLVEWHRRTPNVKVLDLSRNFGHQRALLAGLSHARGDIVACIDGDLQDPPHLIPEMVAVLQRDNADVVYGVRRHRKEGFAKKMAYWIAYRIMRRLMDIELPLDSGDFAVMRRPVLNAILQMPEQSLFLRGLRTWVGFRQTPFEYSRSARYAGEAKYKWRDLFHLAYNGIYSFTTLPIRMLGILGMLSIVFSVAYTVYLLLAWSRGSPSPQGFTTLVLALIFFSGVQLVAIRIVGSYIHRIYDEVRSRPPYLVRAFWSD